MKTLITAENISVCHDKKTVLQDVSVEVKHNDFVTIIGPNGAGKTTLLHCLIGIIEPHAGTIWRQKHLRIGYVPQSITIVPTIPMTVRHFLTLTNNKAARYDQFDTIVDHVAIAEYLDSPLSTLSGGELQLVFLARALLHDPQLVILDEPTQNLDISRQLDFYHRIDMLQQQKGFSIVMVSHDLHFVMRRTRRVICLSCHICCSGSPKDIADDPAFKKLFGHSLDG